jgi:hypothetical protein
MPDQVKNKSTVAEQDQQHVIEIALPSSISTSDRLLRRIATLLFLLVAGMLTVFGYYASSICITVVLAAFLAILFDPMVVKVEKLRLPRGVSAARAIIKCLPMLECGSLPLDKAAQRLDLQFGMVSPKRQCGSPDP